MQEYNKDAWVEIVRRCEEAGVDAFEVNFSCPHGMPERKMGMAMGQCPELLEVPPLAHWRPPIQAEAQISSAEATGSLTELAQLSSK